MIGYENYLSPFLWKEFFRNRCSFFAAQHLRGQQNRPAYIPMIAQALADLRGINKEGWRK
jgi:Tat protein secretion system quality control protein TatD with DNase activity